MKHSKIPSANDVETLAQKCARELAENIRQQAEQRPIALPLEDKDIQHLLDATIEDLRRAGKISWFGISTDRRQIFVDAWTREMTRQGIRN